MARLVQCHGEDFIDIRELVIAIKQDIAHPGAINDFGRGNRHSVQTVIQRHGSHPNITEPAVPSHHSRRTERVATVGYDTDVAVCVLSPTLEG